MTLFAKSLLVGLAGLFLMATSSVADVRLIMFDRHGCFYCQKWKAEIKPIYPKTTEGRIAPLSILDMDGHLPKELQLTSRPTLSPTFVLLDGNTEIARIEGYGGDEMFWWMLDSMIQKLPAEKRRDPGA